MIDDGGPMYAAPANTNPGEWSSGQPGCTYRWWIAGMATAGLMADPNCDAPANGVADAAVKVADALIARLRATEAAAFDAAGYAERLRAEQAKGGDE